MEAVLGGGANKADTDRMLRLSLVLGQGRGAFESRPTRACKGQRKAPDVAGL